MTNTLESEDKNLAGIGMYLCNTTNQDDTVTIYAIQSGDNASDTNTVVKNLVVDGGETYEFGAEKFVLQSGERIAAKADVGQRVSATITYMEI